MAGNDSSKAEIRSRQVGSWRGSMQTQMLAHADPAAATEPKVAEAFGEKPVIVFKI